MSEYKYLDKDGLIYYHSKIKNLLSGKVDKENGKGLSTNDYTTTEKNKLNGIASGAEVNQNAFSNVKVGSTTVSADSKTDTLELVGGSNITLTPDATNDKVTESLDDTVNIGSLQASEAQIGNVVVTGTSRFTNVINGVNTYPLKWSYNSTYPSENFMAIGNAKVGPAIIKTVLNNEDVKEYQIEIVSINEKSSTKNITLKITDEELLNQTGGVIQGMSGSPIIQDNQIVGVLTHVVVENPLTGYGLFITKMLEEGEK